MEDNEALIESASRGEEEAVEILLQRYLPRLRAFLRLRLAPEIRAKESCSDLVQSTCREVLQHIDRFQYRGEHNFRHWLFATALRKLSKRGDYYHAAKRSVGREVDLGAAPGQSGEDQLAAAYQTLSTPSRVLSQREQIQAIENVFDQLPDDYREVITLSRLVGLSHQEIAAAMGRSETATRSLLHRALAQLADALARSNKQSD